MGLPEGGGCYRGAPHDTASLLASSAAQRVVEVALVGRRVEGRVVGRVLRGAAADARDQSARPGGCSGAPVVAGSASGERTEVEQQRFDRLVRGQRQLERLAAGELDAALVANLDPQHRQRFALRPLGKHRFVAALPESHRLAARTSLSLAELRTDDFVSLSDVAFPGRREFLRGACAAAGFEPRIVHEVDSVALMLGAVAAGDGVAVVPRHSAKIPHGGCVLVALQAPVPVVELMLATARGEPTAELSALAAALVARAKLLADG